MKIAVTGASGFVATNLIPILAEEHKVLALTSQGNLDFRHDNISSTPYKIPSDSKNLVKDLSGIDVVVHLAAKVHDLSHFQDMDEYIQINVEGTRTLLEAAKSNNVNRFIYLSSIKVHGEKTEHGFSINESSPFNPQDPYSQSKLHCEELVKRFCTDNQMGYVILRPPLIYGESVKANFLKLMGLSQKSLPLPLKSIRNSRSLLYVKNLCDIIRLSLEHEAAVNQAFVLKDCDLSTPELIRAIGETFGTSPRLFSFPVVLIKILGSMIGRRNQVDRLTDSLSIDNSKVINELGWQPGISMQEAMNNTVNWYQHR